MLERQSRALISRIITWFLIQTWVKKLASRIGAQGPVTSAKMRKYTLIMRLPTKKTNPKLSNFLYLNCNASGIFKGFEQLSSSIGWGVMVMQISTRKVAHAGLKASRRSFNFWRQPVSSEISMKSLIWVNGFPKFISHGFFLSQLVFTTSVNELICSDYLNLYSSNLTPHAKQARNQLQILLW